MASSIQVTWPRCPEAFELLNNLYAEFAIINPSIRVVAERFFNTCGVDIRNLIDHWMLPNIVEIREKLISAGFEEREIEGGPVWIHPVAQLAQIRLQIGRTIPVLSLKSDSVSAFLKSNNFSASQIEGNFESRYQLAYVQLEIGGLQIISQSGYNGYTANKVSTKVALDLAKVRDWFRKRERNGDEIQVIKSLSLLFECASSLIGRDRAVDIFFETEREFYVSRNAAARKQLSWQTECGFGWANQDHHTYRSSRAAFQSLIQLWHNVGFVSRERFYAGEQAGWGAQVMEHPVSRVVLFCDVDVAPDELDTDFAAVPLPERNTLGTIGLWCALHGSSIAAAGMHHLECEFDFEKAKALMESAGFKAMPPFTDLPMLKQAFTAAELWQVAPERMAPLIARGAITKDQAEKFATVGAPGSHLEILQRWDGFKGFNKTGVSSIIRDTDARRS